MSDVTVVLTVHDATVVLGRTLRAVDLAAAAARARGLSVQTVIALDRPTPAVEAYLATPRFPEWERLPLDREVPGALSRLVTATDGRYAGVVRAGDLISENWLAESVAFLDRAAAESRRVVAEPELVVEFDGARRVIRNAGSSAPLFTPYAGYFVDPYEAPCLAPRQAHLEVLEHDPAPIGSDQVEAWHFTLATLALGWEHAVVSDTIAFRRRDDRAIPPTTPPLVRSPGLEIDRVPPTP